MDRELHINNQKTMERIKVCSGADNRIISLEMPADMESVRAALEEEYSSSTLQLWFRVLPFWQLIIRVGGARHLPRPEQNEQNGTRILFCEVHFPTHTCHYDGAVESPQVIRTAVVNCTDAADWDERLSIIVDGSVGGGDPSGSGCGPELHVRVMEYDKANGSQPNMRPLGDVHSDLAALGAFLALEQARANFMYLEQEQKHGAETRNHPPTHQQANTEAANTMAKQDSKTMGSLPFALK